MIDVLLSSLEPAIQYKTRVGALGECRDVMGGAGRSRKTHSMRSRWDSPANAQNNSSSGCCIGNGPMADGIATKIRRRTRRHSWRCSRRCAASRHMRTCRATQSRAPRCSVRRRCFSSGSSSSVDRREQPFAAEFTQLHYPLYWHYDILGGLKVLAEADLMSDPRCSAALDMLLKKRLLDALNVLARAKLE